MDDAFRILSDTHRRRLLVALLDADPRSDEGLAIPEAVHRGDRERHRLHVEMVHTHCPLLEAAGVIRWDRDANEVQTGPRFEELRPLLELLDENAATLPGEWI